MIKTQSFDNLCMACGKARWQTPMLPLNKKALLRYVPSSNLVAEKDARGRSYTGELGQHHLI